ncbi:thioredoxin family protein [Polaromonas sp.]|uniref:thioredoxin family protein n=1 Tax=Polaromonas sp. TaxID=1869339 RepID=UPI003267A3CF
MNPLISSADSSPAAHGIERRTFLATLLALSVGQAAATAAPSFFDRGAAPEFSGIDQWLNSQPLTMAGLRGKVVLIDFWTYACINCLRTLPHINRWAATYRDQGLVVGVHTPEFPFERSTSNVQTAMQRCGVKHPVAQDNSYRTWKAYNNKYWPATYLVDANGRIQYQHFGEGQYAQTEAAIRAIRALLATAAKPGPRS